MRANQSERHLAPRFPARRSLAMTAGVLACVLAVPSVPSVADVAQASPVHGIRPLVGETIGERGGVLMIPLGAEKPGNRWPATVSITLADGREIGGSVAWVRRPSDRPARARRWTDEPGPLAARWIEPADDTSAAMAGAPYLLARSPVDADGPVDVAGRVVRVIWCDRPAPGHAPGMAGPDRPSLDFEPRPDRPPTDTPFAYWRWVLLADRLDLRPPGSDRYGEAGALVAEHGAGLWRLALQRLARESPAVATTCRDLLTRTGLDGGRPMAMWIADPEETGQLLGALLDFTQRDELVMRQALAWADTRAPLAAWSEAGFGASVTLHVINMAFGPLVARLTWEAREDPAAEVPLAVELPPGSLTRIPMTRPPLPEPDPLGLVEVEEPATQILSLACGPERVRMSFGRRLVEVTPPGAFLPPFRSPLTLAEVQTSQQAPVAPSLASSAQLRRRRGRWEAFFECRRDRSAVSPAGADGDPLGGFARPLEVLGVEAVTLWLGPLDEPTVVLAVPESGRDRLFAGTDDGTLEIHRMSFADRWYCRVVLPDAWVEPDSSVWSPLLVGCRRTHGDGDAAETTPGTGPPWRQRPSRAALDLRSWDRGERR